MDTKNVFINCPFDNEFYPLLKGIFFVLIYLDFKPKIAETSDSGQVRILKIKDLMLSSPLSIHDLSRIDPLVTDAAARLNMAFEMGIDFGLKYSGIAELEAKRFLILEKEDHRYKTFLSDISGNDIKSHRNDPELVIKSIRDWIKAQGQEAAIPRHKLIFSAYNEFSLFYNQMISSEGYDPKEITAVTFSDVIEIMANWIGKFKKV
ncbi:hypothetical protein J0A67_07010 [Algoriphagus aestuariicola]|uniref:Uncharacterized protein n=1 Tax=Algoriphagus aestuariicola TaxID=1852016 RepID=A0ABS3BN66_9BACT|nr:hypothetical protein [Algoriphagus aestuariicola]MBN7800603.1 hypothetical protein [Algoriphagus aestuariicola]